jgi:diguanylate cyclase (GGDEF)-like protein
MNAHERAPAPAPPPASDLSRWRLGLLRSMLLAMALLGGLVALPGVWAAVQARAWGIALADVGAVAWLLLLWAAERLDWRLRVWGFLLLPMGLGALFLVTIGAHGLLYLLVAPVLASLLLGWRSAALATALGLAILLAVGPEQGPMNYRAPPGGELVVSWWMLLLNYAFLTVVVTLSTAMLLRRLEQAVDDAQRASRALEQLALYDGLTGLPNRSGFLEALERALEQARRRTVRGALLFIDLDHFKNVNDTRGHAAGDELLRLVTRRLQSVMRSGDTLARLGGDEFVVLLPDLGPEAEAASRGAMLTAERLRQALARLPATGVDALPTTMSVGVALFPGEGQSADDLLREADTAMYRAKSQGRNRIAFFEQTMQSELQERLALEHDLAQALAGGDLHLAAQTQFDGTGRRVGAELLLRWTHPQRGAVSPAVFIPLAEQSGQIVVLGEWVLRQACALSCTLRAQGLALPLSVNISPRQFRQPGFVERTRALLAASGARAEDLIFEVTEGLLIEDVDGTVARMQELVALGLRFSVDDFGTGYSSLAYLKRLPLHELKIDRTFVQDTPDDANDTAIVRLVLSMAAELGLQVVAEGVETQRQADFLLAHGCDRLQGFLLARPQPLPQWLAGLGA